jgi:hypothetical protein
MIAAMRGRYGLAVLAGLVVLAGSVLPSVTNASLPSGPPTFVVVTQGGQQSRLQMSIHSSVTGAVVRSLASFSEKTFTNNGLAYAPDGSAVYFTLFRRRHTGRFVLRLMRLDVATGRETFIADGAQPALSNDGTQLAYGAFPQGLAVRDLATGQTRTIGLGQLGRAANLLNATIGWLGSGSDIAIIPAPIPWDLVGRPPKLHWCGTTQTRAVIVFVHVPTPPAPMTADCVHLAGRALLGRIALAGNPASANSVLVAIGPYGTRTLVEQIAETGATTRELTIANSLPLAFDPSGTHLLYLVGHSPPTLTEATIANGRVINGPWRNRHLALGALAW